ncbi:MAG TPA: hypothetical protein DEF45_20015 [Rhodopirellula sp.]|nr:hypothetical protein [Rhodopirellula sp.]
MPDTAVLAIVLSNPRNVRVSFITITSLTFTFAFRTTVRLQERVIEHLCTQKTGLSINACIERPSQYRLCGPIPINTKLFNIRMHKRSENKIDERTTRPFYKQV